MITRIFREGELFGQLQSSVYTAHDGRVPLEAWFCPHCGRIFAIETVEFEEGETKPEQWWNIMTLPCGSALHDISAPHPSYWACADHQLLNNAFKEAFENVSRCVITNYTPAGELPTGSVIRGRPA